MDVGGRGCSNLRPGRGSQNSLVRGGSEAPVVVDCASSVEHPAHVNGQGRFGLAVITMGAGCFVAVRALRRRVYVGTRARRSAARVGDYPEPATEGSEMWRVV